MFEYSTDNKRYHTLNYYFKNKYKKKVFKVSLNANFTCPNRDGIKGYGGCIFCNDVGSGTFAGNPKDDLVRQFTKVRDVLHKKWSDAYYIGYFQAFTNTYADINTLKSYYETILSLENVVGLAIATRADCISDELIEYLSKLNTKYELWIELGLQSSSDKSAKLLNRGHTFLEYKNTVIKLRKKGIKVCTHLINGIPGETSEQMVKSVQDVIDIGVDGIKIHMMHILKGTALEKYYNLNKFHILSRKEFVEIVCNQLEIIPKEVVIFRLSSDSDEDELIHPSWILKKFVVLNEIDKELLNRNSFQGYKYIGGNYEIK